MYEIKYFRRFKGRNFLFMLVKNKINIIRKNLIRKFKFYKIFEKK